MSMSSRRLWDEALIELGLLPLDTTLVNASPIVCAVQIPYPRPLPLHVPAISSVALVSSAGIGAEVTAGAIACSASVPAPTIPVHVAAISRSALVSAAGVGGGITVVSVDCLAEVSAVGVGAGVTVEAVDCAALVSAAEVGGGITVVSINCSAEVPAVGVGGGLTAVAVDCVALVSEVALGLGERVGPDSIECSALVSDVTLEFGGKVSPTAVTRFATVYTVTTGAGAGVGPDPIVCSAFVSAVTVQFGGRVGAVSADCVAVVSGVVLGLGSGVTAVPVDCAALVSDLTVQYGGRVGVVSVSCLAVVSEPTVGGGSGVGAVSVDCAATVSAVTVNLGGGLLAVAVGCSASVSEPTLQYGGKVSPVSITILSAVYVVTVGAGAGVGPDPIACTSLVSAVTLQYSGKVTATPITCVAGVPTAEAGTGGEAAPDTIACTVEVPSPAGVSPRSVRPASINMWADFPVLEIGMVLINNGYATSDLTTGVSGDLDVRAKVRLYDQGILILLWKPDTVIFGLMDNQLYLAIETNDAGEFEYGAELPGTLGQSFWIRCHVDVDDGAGKHVVTFYWSKNGTDWTQLATIEGQPQNADDSGLANNASSPFIVGGASGFLGFLHEVAAYDDDTLILNPQFDTWWEGGSVGEDAQGNTWTLSGTFIYFMPFSYPEFRGGGGVAADPINCQANVPPPADIFNNASITADAIFCSAEVPVPTGVFTLPIRSPPIALSASIPIQEWCLATTLSGGYAVSNLTAPVAGDPTVIARIVSDDWMSPGLVAGQFDGIFLAYMEARLWFVWQDSESVQQQTMSDADLYTVGYEEGTPVWLKAVLDLDNGAGAWEVEFFTSPDGVVWSQLGTTQVGENTTSLYASSDAPYMAGMLDGKLFEVYIYDGATQIVSPDFTEWVPGQTVGLDAQSNTWTLAGSATIVAGGFKVGGRADVAVSAISCVAAVPPVEIWGKVVAKALSFQASIPIPGIQGSLARVLPASISAHATVPTPAVNDFPLFPSVRSSVTSVVDPQATSATIRMPPVVGAGDTLLCFAHFPSWDWMPTDWPDDWEVLVSSRDLPGQESLGGISEVAFKLADGTEGDTTITVDYNPGGTPYALHSAHITYAIKDAANPLCKPPAAVMKGYSQTRGPDPLELVPPYGTQDYLWFAGLWTYLTNLTAWPSGYNDNRQIVTTGGRIAFPADAYVAAASRTNTAASEDPSYFTVGSTYNFYQVATVAIHPAAGFVCADPIDCIATVPAPAAVRSVGRVAAIALACVALVSAVVRAGPSLLGGWGAIPI